MADDGRTGKTFFLNTPADLLEKLRWEKDALWASAPFDLQQRAYMVMNCLITSWQMKDWVYSALKVSGRLKDLNVYARRKIKGKSDFGVYLVGALPQMKLAYQIATASKHREITKNKDPNVRTEIGMIRIELRGGYERSELFVLDGQERMVAHDLVCRLYVYWKRVLHDLSLTPEEEPFVPEGDRPSPSGTPRLRLKRPE
jgi:hypothetical protein